MNNVNSKSILMNLVRIGQETLQQKSGYKQIMENSWEGILMKFMIMIIEVSSKQDMIRHILIGRALSATRPNFQRSLSTADLLLLRSRQVKSEMLPM